MSFWVLPGVANAALAPLRHFVTSPLCESGGVVLGGNCIKQTSYI